MSTPFVTIGTVRSGTRAPARPPEPRPLQRGLCRALVALALSACVCVCVPGEGWAQVVASDYMAYPKNMSLMDELLRRDRLELTFARWPGLSVDYKLGPGDELQIEVFGTPVMNQSMKVSGSGMITFPLVGEIRAADLTAVQLEEAIAVKLRDLKLIERPEVLVHVTAYESKQIYVFGAIDRPGLYQMSQDLRVMDAIFMAGGIDPNAGKYGYVHRKVSELGPDWPGWPRRMPVPVAAPVDERTGNVRMPSPRDIATTPAARALIEHPDTVFPGTEVMKFDIENAKKGGLVEPNLLLKAGDIVVIAEETKNAFYVIGDVRNPAAVQMPGPSYRKIYISQAISWVGGPLRTAKVSQGLLIRVGADGVRKEFKFDYNAVIHGKQPDLEVQPNDILFIPGSNSKTLAYAILGILPATAIAQGAEQVR